MLDVSCVSMEQLWAAVQPLQKKDRFHFVWTLLVVASRTRYEKEHVVFINAAVNFTVASLLGRAQHEIGFVCWVSLNFPVQDEKGGI